MSYENHTVLLDDNTVGTVSRASIDYENIHGFVGQELDVQLHDDGGNPIRRRGTVIEVLEVAYLDQE